MADERSEVVTAAERAGVVGFNSALDALFIRRTSSSQCIAWTSGGMDRMVSRNLGPRGRGSWGESNVFTADRAAEFVEDAEDVSVLDKRPFNFIRSAFERTGGLSVGTAWAVAFFFEDAARIVNAREETLKSVPGVGDRKARAIRRAVGHREPPQEWSE
ncbi:hypothetical protein [Halobaculum sp. D14]|uniref:hypothetical protein n=1 Tax=Halobaculum sp. D14 TaxID=3421642 RepID=UPI003EBCEE1B